MSVRGDRAQRRAAARAERGRTQLQVPEQIRALAPRRQRPPCPIDPTCTRDHLKRKDRSWPA